MDPNATLTMLREAVSQFWSAADGDGADADAEHAAAAAMAEHAEALDAWLSRRGFLPDAWTHPGGPAPRPR